MARSALLWLVVATTAACTSSKSNDSKQAGGANGNSGGAALQGGTSAGGGATNGGVTEASGGRAANQGGGNSGGRVGNGGASVSQGGAVAHTGGASDAGAAGAAGGWVLKHIEDFSATTLPATAWSADAVPDDGPFGDEGVYFEKQGISAPSAFRITQAFGATEWLTLESYSRENTRPLSEFASVVADPAGGTNKVLRVRSLKHTDATIVRPSAALPSRYRISVRVGYPSFGDGTSKKNGYDAGDESAEPWLDDPAVSENGFYWLTILDSVPRPHNNVWIHHHRKVCIDSDNTTDGWMNVWNGSACEESGAHPIMMFALDGTSSGSVGSGKSFLSYRGGKWSNDICAADSYRADRWYVVSIERFDDRFTLSVTGDFEHGGTTTYTSSIDAADKCVFHYNNTALPSSHPCVDTRSYSELGSNYPHWPSGVAYPDYFMFGEPHENFYEGSVYYDDVRLELWEGAAP